MPDFLSPQPGTIFWMLIAFSAVFFLLKKFAWKPILSALKAREDSIDDALKAADAAKEEMQKLTADNEKIIAKAKKERDSIIKEARSLKDTMIEDAKENAIAEGDKIIEAARAAIKSEKELAIKGIKEHAALLSIQIAEKLLKEKLASDEEQKDLINKLLRDIETN